MGKYRNRFFPFLLAGGLWLSSSAAGAAGGGDFVCSTVGTVTLAVERGYQSAAHGDALAQLESDLGALMEAWPAVLTEAFRRDTVWVEAGSGAVEYRPADSVSWALYAMRRNRITPLLVTRDPNITPRNLKAMFGMGAGLADGDFLYYLRSYLPILVIGILAATPLAKTLWNKASLRARQVAIPVLVLGGLVLATAYLVDGTYNPFLYFRF